MKLIQKPYYFEFMSEDLDCYILVDLSQPEETRTMMILCVECRNNKMPDSGVFYAGSKEGYSDFDWHCCLCNKQIHKPEGANED